MLRKTLTVIVCLAAISTFSGCLGAFAANQGRRSAARNADRYVKQIDVAGDSPEAQAQARQARNDLADTIVRTGNDRYQNKVGVNDRGWLTNER